MKADRRAFERLLEIMDRVMAQAESMHSAPRDFGTGVPLHRTEIHTIQAIGENPGINLTGLARRMGVTKGAVSQTVSRLVEKALVRKSHPPGNAKEIRLELTDLGRIGYRTHERFHTDMFETITGHFGKDSGRVIKGLTAALGDLEVILEKYDRRVRGR